MQRWQISRPRATLDRDLRRSSAIACGRSFVTEHGDVARTAIARSWRSSTSGHRRPARLRRRSRRGTTRAWRRRSSSALTNSADRSTRFRRVRRDPRGPRRGVGSEPVRRAARRPGRLAPRLRSAGTQPPAAPARGLSRDPRRSDALADLIVRSARRSPRCSPTSPAGSGVRRGAGRAHIDRVASGGTVTSERAADLPGLPRRDGCRREHIDRLTTDGH